jgi:phosphoserine phosphatase RsbU/P
VREVLAAAQLDDLLDDALLLATELTTNAVLHVGEEILVLIEASDNSVTVTIRDTERDELPRLDASVAVDYPLANTGRGLLLVDKIAYRWGTTQEVSGKAVWFELSRGGSTEAPAHEETWRNGTRAGFRSWLRRRLPWQQSRVATGD